MKRLVCLFAFIGSLCVLSCTEAGEGSATTGDSIHNIDDTLKNDTVGGTREPSH